jgi:hypothetical protein
MTAGKRPPEQWVIDYGLFARMTGPDRMTPGQRTIYEFCAAVRRGDPIPDAILEDLAGRLERVMTGKVTAGKALGVEKQRGGNAKRDPQEHWRRVHIAATVLAEKRRRPGLTIAAIARRLVECGQFEHKPTFIVDQYEKHKADAALYVVAVDQKNPECGAAVFKLMARSGFQTFNGAPIKPPRVNR